MIVPLDAYRNVRYADRGMPNPFEFSDPVLGASFADRKAELKTLTTRMLAGQNVIVISPRRYGKTSLILNAQAAVRRRGGRTGIANLFWCQNRQDVAQELANAVVHGPLGPLRGRMEELRRRLSNLPGAALSIEKDGYRLSLSPLKPQSDWTTEIRRVMQLLREAQSDRHPVSLVIDEFQKVAEIDPALPGLFKSLTDSELRGVSLVLSGSRRHVMHQLHAGPGAPMLGVGELMTLDLVPEADMVAFLRQRAEAEGKRMSEAAARLLFSRARGVPAYVQRLAFEAFESGERNIDEAVAELAVTTVLRRERQYFEVIYEDLAPNQRSLIRALAAEPARSITSRDFLDRAGLRADSSSQRALSALEAAEKVGLGPDGWQVSDPLLALWLARGGVVGGGLP
ncbi:MAG TPA: hypothetical protein VND96_01525 [Candidatus Micrarchaeaceae archaeon]|nr:hypothetical protein [Candidatus Micrarchaeaceae archaeon]